MFTSVTWQDYLAAEDRGELLLSAVGQFKASRGFLHALEANSYFRGENTRVARKTILRARKTETRDKQGRRRVRAAAEDVVGNRIGSSFLFRFVTQQNQFLLSEGVSLPWQVKDRLGADFDHQLERLGECALLHGCAWGYWNTDHLEVLQMARNSLSGFFPLLDEMTGEAKLGVQFWQIAPSRPMYLRIFSDAGVTLCRREKGKLVTISPCQPYRRTLRQDVLGETIADEPGYSRLPLIPLRANPEGRSEFTPAIRAKIDAYDSILSDFADNLDRANDVYWVLNNFGGTMDEVAEMLEQINRLKAVANIADGTGQASTAEPHTIEVPYQARRTALEMLEHALYQDYMALDMSALTGSSLTNVAIRVSTSCMNLKANRYEWQVRQFVTALLELIGCPCKDVIFRRQAIANESETIADIAAMRGDIDHETALRLNPYISDESIPTLLGASAKPSHS
ncbi:MAG: phage portal protein [Clostridia bacterium]|nr:phage portal protein [Clostridia bacterium]